MKNSIIGGLVGLSIVLSIDTLSRIILSLYIGSEFQVFAYSEYPGILWPVFLVGVAGFSSFLGALFSLTYGKNQRVASIVTFLFLLISLRYAQIHLLFEIDPFYSITALIFSLFTVIIAWKLTARKKEKSKSGDETEFKQTHHQPEQSGS